MEIEAAVREVAKKNHAKFALLFGSYARGTPTRDSDIDVIFVEKTSTDERYLKRLDRYFDPLSEKLKMGIELFVYSPAEFERMKKKPFVSRALKEGIVIYES